MENRKIRLGIVAGLISLVVSAGFHGALFRHVISHVEAGLNGTFITVSLALLLLLLNFAAFYLILWLGRGVGKAILSFFFIGNATALYFIRNYDVMLDDTMMGNVFNTNTAEATGFFSPSFIAYLLLLGILPAVLLFITRIDWGGIKRFASRTGISIGLALVIILGNMTNFPWVDRNAPVIGSLFLPWSYVVNTFRYQAKLKRNNAKEILLPDATISNNEKDVVILLIGESARRDHFQLYGYDRPTNPLLAQRDDIRAYKANSAATYTTAGVKAILDHTQSSKLYEILPNYLFRTGVDVIWHSSNWGQSPLHIDKFKKIGTIGREIGAQEPFYDELLLTGIRDEIESSATTRSW